MTRRYPIFKTKGRSVSTKINVVMRAFLLLFGLLAASGVAAQTTATQAPIFSTDQGAIKGYDPVAYFAMGQPQRGLDSITYAWQGATWHFGSVAHRDSFALQPEKYAPQYGGYCAYGWAQGYAVKIEPDAWAIINGKLYLNYDQSVQRKWNKKRTQYIREADQNWSKNNK
jgi:hypothetical protein